MISKNWQTGCRHFSGYKPCGKNQICDELCPSRDIPQVRILIVHLEALGAVLRSTALLKPIKRKYPSSHITWVTSKTASHLLANNPLIDRILTTETNDLLALKAFEFDIGFCIDKAVQASAVIQTAQVDQVFGFRVDARSGAILPATEAAEELWLLGLDNHKKFFVNQKAETQLTAEALELDYQRDPYILKLTQEEIELSQKRRNEWKKTPESILVGINTGCSPVIPYKKLSIDMHLRLIAALNQIPGVIPVLLGGKEDRERNQILSEQATCISSPTDFGLRDGAISMEACDMVISGDSLGMHMGIALKKWSIAWFGPTCAQEIDLFENGVKVLTQASCSPCWKRKCNKDVMCYDLVSIEEILRAVHMGLARAGQVCYSLNP